jgi:hypothetical protein
MEAVARVNNLGKQTTSECAEVLLAAASSAAAAGLEQTGSSTVPAPAAAAAEGQQQSQKPQQLTPRTVARSLSGLHLSGSGTAPGSPGAKAPQPAWDAWQSADLQSGKTCCAVLCKQHAPHMLSARLPACLPPPGMMAAAHAFCPLLTPSPPAPLPCCSGQPAGADRAINWRQHRLGSPAQPGAVLLCTFGACRHQLAPAYSGSGRRPTRRKASGGGTGSSSSRGGGAGGASAIGSPGAAATGRQQQQGRAAKRLAGLCV